MSYYDTFMKNTPAPKDRWDNAMQALVNKTFTNASSYQKDGIEEEVAFGSMQFKTIPCRVVTIIDALTGQRISDDYRKIIFPDLKHKPELGTRYRFENNIWITYSVENMLTATSSVYVRRCNNTFNYQDKHGCIHREPCVIDYKINETQLQRTTEMEVPNSRLQIFCQQNIHSDRIKINDRFLLGTNAYKIRMRGDFDYRETFNQKSNKLLNYFIEYDDASADDRFDLGVANYIEYNYKVILPFKKIDNLVGFSNKISGTVTSNGEKTSEPIVWESTDNRVAEINRDTGEYIFKQVGTCGFIAHMKHNPEVVSAIQINVVDELVEEKHVVFSPMNCVVKLNSVQEFEVYEYENGMKTGTEFDFEFFNIPDRYYKVKQTSGNSFNLLNLKQCAQKLLVNCKNKSDSSIHTFVIELGGLL